MYFFYGEDEKAYKSCYNGVKKAYPSANYKVVAGYGHLTYSIKNTADYIDRIKSVCEGNIATGGKVYDCTYISKNIASKEEFQEYEKRGDARRDKLVKMKDKIIYFLNLGPAKKSL